LAKIQKFSLLHSNTTPKYVHTHKKSWVTEPRNDCFKSSCRPNMEVSCEPLFKCQVLTSTYIRVWYLCSETASKLQIQQRRR